jgi:hypothetical protein
MRSRLLPDRAEHLSLLALSDALDSGLDDTKAQPDDVAHDGLLFCGVFVQPADAAVAVAEVDDEQ